ncbi:hypothetical protein EYZ11_007936 [Aspergillus tanneri]|nr:hypothetical protein EYZ11_007936 [Aspergillus tanneri]
MSMSHLPEPNPPQGFEVKRRKIRKGTSSCWECKRRKIRCTFGPTLDNICVGCQRRGTRCLSQEFPEEACPPRDRFGRIEARIDQLAQTVSAGSSTNTNRTSLSSRGERPPTFGLARIPSRSSREVESAGDLASAEPSVDGFPLEEGGIPQDSNFPDPGSHYPDTAKHAKLSQALHAALPSPEDLEIMLKAGAHVSIYFHQVMMAPYSDVERDGLDLLGTAWPDPDTHPVLLAKYIFLLAITLQYVDPESYEQINRMSEPPRVIMTRLANTAIDRVTAHDELLGTVEGLECVVLEGIYQANCGNLRRAWIAFRRAMALGQLMGIHRDGHRPLKVIDSRTTKVTNTSFLWYRIVNTDRFLCLMLGLPQGSLDRSMSAESALAQDTPIGRLERLHCTIASLILERNEKDPGSYSFETTKEIDLKLQEAAQTMPSGWWLGPNLPAAAASHDEQTVFWEMLRLVSQLFHYNLLNQLHLPFMLRFTSSERRYDYTQATCVNASREVLTRFISFRSFNRVPYCCRAVDFFALQAALTLLLAHLDSHRRRASTGDLSSLAHQRLSDRAMMEQVVWNMDQINQVSRDALSAKSASLLRRLLAIEAEAASGSSYITQNERACEGQPPSRAPDESNVLRIRIPYFGTIRIAPECLISKEVSPEGAALSLSDIPARTGVGGGHGAPATPTPSDTISMEMPQVPPHGNEQQVQAQLDDHSRGGETTVPYTDHDRVQQQYLHPGLTAGVDDWAFQGVDMAYFTSLMGGSMLTNSLGSTT